MSLHSLNQALRPFRGSYHSTRLVITSFCTLLGWAESERSTAQFQDLWQLHLSLLRDPDEHDYYRDPESLQVAQVLSKLRCLDDLAELRVNKHLLHGRGSDTRQSKVGSYTSVSRAMDWLVECAKLDDLNSLEGVVPQAHLDHLKQPQPRYEATDGSDEGFHGAQEPQMFGASGLLLPALTWAVEVSRDSPVLVQKVIDIVLREAMSIADIWEYSLKYGIRPVQEQPDFKWYILGLKVSRDAFKERIVDYSEPDINHLPYGLRDVLKRMPFVALWNRLWQQARMLSVRRSAEYTRLHYSMYDWVLTSFRYATVFPISGPGLLLIHQAVAMERSQDIANRVPGPFRPKYCPRRVDLVEIEATQAHLMECHWGRRFYGAELPLGFSTNADDVYEFMEPLQLQDDVNDRAALEAYGPSIEPLESAQVVSGEDRPTHRNCTICAEEYACSRDCSPCVKLSTCGHYFHYECIHSWMNGVAANRNRCPECRTQICENRRPVRAIALGQPGQLLETNSELSDLARDDDDAMVPETQDTLAPQEHYSPGDEGLPGVNGSDLEQEATEAEQPDSRRDEDEEEEPDNELDFNEEERDDDEINSGYALFNPDDSETFQPAGLTEDRPRLSTSKTSALSTSKTGNLTTESSTLTGGEIIYSVAIDRHTACTSNSLSTSLTWTAVWRRTMRLTVSGVTMFGTAVRMRRIGAR